LKTYDKFAATGVAGLDGVSQARGAGAKSSRMRRYRPQVRDLRH
jgi:hypothetical protein